ncbi:MAG TPA: hypothetical protein VGN16_25935 [Acidobacteriaceae bacterium]|jgi:hypothetical protein
MKNPPVTDPLLPESEIASSRSAHHAEQERSFPAVFRSAEATTGGLVKHSITPVARIAG